SRELRLAFRPAITKGQPAGKEESLNMPKPSQLKTPTVLFLVALLLACFVIPQTAQAVVPPPDGGYPNFTTAEGDNALRSLTTGVGNTAIGTFSLSSVTTGSFNTAVGAGALDR